MSIGNYSNTPTSVGQNAHLGILPQSVDGRFAPPTFPWKNYRLLPGNVLSIADLAVHENWPPPLLICPGCWSILVLTGVWQATYDHVLLLRIRQIWNLPHKVYFAERKKCWRQRRITRQMAALTWVGARPREVLHSWYISLVGVLPHLGVLPRSTLSPSFSEQAGQCFIPLLCWD